MAAKPRVTVRLAPADLHALAFIAARDRRPPAELARMMVAAQIGATLAARGWTFDQAQSWRSWLAEQAARGERPESPTQDDYDQLAVGLPAAPPAPPADTRHTPRSETSAASDALIRRVSARLGGGRSRA